MSVRIPEKKKKDKKEESGMLEMLLKNGWKKKLRDKHWRNGMNLEMKEKRRTAKDKRE